MKLSEIQAFLAVKQYGSLSKAAEALYITQPTLSHRLHNLEAELNATLLDRNKGQKNVELTDAGKAFIIIAEKWALLWEESLNAVSAVPRPKLRIAATQTLSNYVMPNVYAKFLKRNYPVDLELYSFHYQESYVAIENHKVDLVIVSRTMASNRVSAIHVLSEKMVLLCRKDSLYVNVEEPSTLPTSKCIYMLWNHEYSMWHQYWFGTSQPRVYADNMKLVEKILSTTDMWAFAPISAAREVSENSNLVYHALKTNSPPDRPIFALTLEPMHPYTKYVVEDLKAVMKEANNSI